MIKKPILLIVFCSVFALYGCTPSASSLRKILEENPSILFIAISKNPREFIEVLNKADLASQQQIAEEKKREQSRSVEEDFKNPKPYEISDHRVTFGEEIAPITIVAYSSFYCPYCASAAITMDQIHHAYGDKVRVIFKHMLTSGRDERAARYFEAIGRQSAAKAKKFHDLLFENQHRASVDNAYIDQAVKQAGADLSKISAIKSSDEITKILNADAAEAQRLGFNGSPGFLVQGVRVAGAYPLEYFKTIIDRHLDQMGLSSGGDDGNAPCKNETTDASKPHCTGGGSAPNEPVANPSRT